MRLLEGVRLKYILSLNTPLGDGDLSLSDTIDDENAVCPGEAVIRKNLAEKTRELLSTLTPEEELILSGRFGIGDGEERILREVGSGLGLTRERIRQIEAKGLKRMRHASRLHKLDSFKAWALRRTMMAGCPLSFGV
jgi:RNA polymerase primary sigma factor